MRNADPQSIDYEALPYRIDLHKDLEDNVWIARCPELPGVKASGETPEEAIAAVREVKDLWIQMAREKGRRIPEPEPEPPYSGKTNLRMSRSLHERAVLAARAQDVSLNVFIVQAISERLERHGYQQVMQSVIAGVTEALQKLPETGAVAWRIAGTNLKPLTQEEAANEEPTLVEAEE